MNFRGVLVLLSFPYQVLQAAPPELDPTKDLPRFAPVDATNALSTFQVKPGFRIELVAAEINVFDPVALSFDENGRLFVIEMTDYSERRDERLGRVRVLEDSDGDGHFEKSSVFADQLPWPTGIICYDGGAFVVASPDILFLKDSDGDGRADVRKTVYTGFGTGKDRLNVQALPNSLNWGLDNRIHGATGPNGGTITNLSANQPALPVNGRDFSFDPRTGQLAPESGGGQYGFSFDSRGRKFVCSNSHHIQAVMYEARYADRNPYYGMPPALVDIAVDGPAAEVYRISPEEPWRVIRTKWRVEGVSPGIVEGGGRSAGYFTGATGLTIYRGSAFPPAFSDNAFTGDAGGNLVHRKLIVQDGAGVKAMRPADEQKVEFLASRDTWFRPVQFANAPDGALYVIDMYRETIEHPWSLPEQIKKHLDLNSGNDRGRIYRVVPENYKQPKVPRLGEASLAQLVSTLGSPNGWHRDTAARLLFQRQDKNAVPLLEAMATNSVRPLGKMHALHALKGLGALNPTTLVAALRDTNELVLTHAVKLSEPFLADPAAGKILWPLLQRLTGDPSIHVRYQLAFTLGFINQPALPQALAAIALNSGQDRWVRAALLSSMARSAGEVFSILSANPQVTGSSEGVEFLKEIVAMIGIKNDAAEVAAVVRFLEDANNSALVFPLISSFGGGLQRAGSLSRNLVEYFAPTFARAREVATDRSANVQLRLQAIQLLGVARYVDAGLALLTLLDQNESDAIRMAALKALSQLSDASVARELIKRFPNMTPRYRDEAMSVILGRPERIAVLLGGLERGTIAPTDLDSSQIKFLLNHRDPGFRSRAKMIFDSLALPRREEVVQAFQPALTMRGDGARGKSLFEERCASCHRLEGVGYPVGPDLVSVKNAGREKLLVNILDPNREVTPNYKAFEVETRNEESAIGLIANETANSVTLRQAFGKEVVILRGEIRRLRAQEQSLMPEGLEQGWTHKDMVDLLEFILR